MDQTTNQQINRRCHIYLLYSGETAGGTWDQHSDWRQHKWLIDWLIDSVINNSFMSYFAKTGNSK